MREFCVWLAKMEIEENYCPLQIRQCGRKLKPLVGVVTKKRNVRQLGVGPIIYRNCSRNRDYDSGIECPKVGR